MKSNKQCQAMDELLLVQSLCFLKLKKYSVAIQLFFDSVFSEVGNIINNSINMYFNINDKTVRNMQCLQ